MIFYFGFYYGLCGGYEEVDGVVGRIFVWEVGEESGEEDLVRNCEGKEEMLLEIYYLVL